MDRRKEGVEDQRFAKETGCYLVSTVVVLDDLVEEGGKHSVRLLITGIEADTRVLVVHSRLDGAINSEAVGSALHDPGPR